MSRYWLPDPVLTTVPALAPRRTGEVVISVPSRKFFELKTSPVSDPSGFWTKFFNVGMLSLTTVFFAVAGLAAPPKKDLAGLAFWAGAPVIDKLGELRTGACLGFLVGAVVIDIVDEPPPNQDLEAGLGFWVGSLVIDIVDELRTGAGFAGAFFVLGAPKIEKLLLLGVGAGVGTGAGAGAGFFTLGAPKIEKVLLLGVGAGVGTGAGAGAGFFVAGFPKLKNGFFSGAGVGAGVGVGATAFLGSGLEKNEKASFFSGAGAGVGAGGGTAFFGSGLERNEKKSFFSGAGVGVGVGTGTETGVGAGVVFSFFF